jgi:hypothetical protein
MGIPRVDGVAEALPGWVAEQAAPWATLATEAWRLILHAEDARLMRAFAACASEAKVARVEAADATTLRQRLLSVPEEDRPPIRQVPLLFAIAYELDPISGVAILLNALDAPIREFAHQDIHDGILPLSATRIYDQASLWRHVFTPALTFTTPRDSDLYFALGAGLAKSKLFTDQDCRDRLEGYLKEKAEAPVIPGQAPDEKKYIHILMIALLYRSAEFMEFVTDFSERYAGLMREKGQESWLPLFKQELASILRRTGRQPA